MNTIAPNNSAQYYQLSSQSQAEGTADSGAAVSQVAVTNPEIYSPNDAYSLNLSPEAQNYLSGQSGQIIQVDNSLNFLDPATTNPQLASLAGESFQPSQLI